MLIEQRVRVEQVVLAVEENQRQLCEESLKGSSDNLLLLLVDEEEDDFTGAVGIRPVTHL